MAAPQPDDELLLIRSQLRKAQREIRYALTMIARRIEREAVPNRQSEEDTRDHDRHTDS